MATTPRNNEGGQAGERITLIDVARDAGVSRATASLVLRGSSLVADETRERVQASMRRLGYVYHRGAASLRTQRSQVVGLIVPDITNPFFAEMTVSIEAHLDAAQHVALLGNTSETLTKQERLLEMMQEYRADGVLLCVANGTAPEQIERLRQSHLPFVLFARYIDGIEADYVGADNIAGAAAATEHLINLGHRRIAFVGGPLGSSARRDRQRGYQETMAAHGLRPDAAEELAGSTSRDDGHRAALALLARPESPTAILCYNDIVAFGVMLGLQRMGRRPGQDVAVIGFDDIAEASLWRPALTTIAISPRRIGEEAAQLLLQRVERPDGPARRVIVPPRLVIRDTCGPAPHARSQ